MRSYIIAAILDVSSFSCKSQQNKSISLFNGKDLKGWHSDVPQMDTNASAKNPFIIRYGMLVSMGKPLTIFTRSNIVATAFCSRRRVRSGSNRGISHLTIKEP